MLFLFSDFHKMLRWVLLGVLFSFSIGSRALAAPIYRDLRDRDSATTLVIAIGDTEIAFRWGFWEETNNKLVKRLVSEIVRRHPAFILHLGDMTNDGASNKNWVVFDRLFEPVRRERIPVLPVIGNQDCYKSVSTANIATALKNIRERFFALKDHRWYSRVFRDAGFIMLNSNYSGMSKDEVQRQKSWYEKILQEMDMTPSIHAIIVACHHPPFTNRESFELNDKRRRDFVMPFLNSKKAMLFLSGHCHSYERFIKDGKTFIVSGGGGGILQKLKTDLVHNPPDQFQGPPIRFVHFCELEFHTDRVTLRIVRLNNDGTFSIAETVSIPFHDN